MGVGYIPDESAYLASLQAGQGPAAGAALPPGWEGAGPELAAYQAALAPTPPPQARPPAAGRRKAQSDGPAPALMTPTMVDGAAPGLLVPGNIDLTDRPNVKNADGSHSSVRSMSFNHDGREVLVPTVSDDGRIMTEDQAIQQYLDTGRHLGTFTTPKAATAYAQRLHLQQQAGNGVIPTQAAAGQASDPELARIANLAPQPGPAGQAPQTIDEILAEPTPTRIGAQPNAGAAAAPSGPDSLERVGADEAALLRDQEETARQQGDLDAEKAQAEADSKYDDSSLAIQHQAELAQASAESGERRRAYEADLNQAIADRKDFKFQDYWADKSTGGKVLAAISVALGAFGAGLAHGPNYASEIIDKAIARDFDLQKARVAAMDDRIAMARTGIMDADKAKAALMVDLGIKNAAALETVAAKLASEKARMGVPQAEINRDKTINGLRAQALGQRNKMLLEHDRQEAEHAKLLIEKQRADAAMLKASRVKGAGKGGAGGKPKLPGEYISEWTGKPATDAERDNDSFAGRMVTQYGIVRGQPPMADKDRRTIQAYLAEALVAEKNPGADWLAKLFQKRASLEERLSPQGRELWQAYKEFIAANLRKESGAAISVSEEQQAFSRFSPAPGDTGKNVLRKQEAMRGVMMDNIQRSYRPKYWTGQLGGGTTSGGPPAPSAAPAATGSKPAPGPDFQRMVTDEKPPRAGWYNPKTHQFKAD